MQPSVAPSERIKCLMQVDKMRYSGFGDCVQQVYKEGGLRSVFRGLGATCVRDVPGNAAYFGTYFMLRREICRLEETPTPSLQATLLAGGMAGVANWIVALPFDTLKSRLQRHRMESTAIFLMSFSNSFAMKAGQHFSVGYRQRFFVHFHPTPPALLELRLLDLCL